MINITYDNKEYFLDWSNLPKLVRYAVSQNYDVCSLPRAEIFKDPTNIKLNSDTFTEEIFFSRLQQNVNNYCQRYTQYVPANAKKMISVGCGIANYELILSQQYPELELYLVDKDNLTLYDGYPKQEIMDAMLTKEDYFSNNQFYHSWDVVSDAISTTNLKQERYNFLNPEDDWPSDVDVVMSLYSWCWNYSFEYYSERLLNSLKIGGISL